MTGHKITIQEQDNIVEFQVYSVEPDDPFAFSVYVNSRGFSGAAHEILYVKEDFEVFISQLEALEKSRQGEAILITPHFRGDCNFKIFSIDRLGHLAAQAEISQRMDIRANWEIFKASVTFEIDPFLLAQILEDFRAFSALYN